MAEIVRTSSFLPLVGRAWGADDGGMFTAHCNAEDREVLLTTRRITSIEMRDGATEIHFTCWCGHDGVLVDRAVDRRASRIDLAGSASSEAPVTGPARQPARPAA